MLILDEAQNLKGLGLDGYIKRRIDHRKSISKINEPAGTLILAGSHLQIMHKMTGFDQPLAQRLGKMHLKPFGPQELLIMGADQGWLDRPRRFHTMYSALGGVPNLWVEFHADCKRKKFIDPVLTGDDYKDDLNWQKSFIQWRIAHLREKPETRFLNPRYVNLPKYGEEILQELVDTYPGISFENLRNKLVNNEIKSAEVVAEKDKLKQSYIDQGVYKWHQDADKFANRDIEISLHNRMNESLSELLYTLIDELRIVYEYYPQGVKELPKKYGVQLYNDIVVFQIIEPNVVFEKLTQEFWKGARVNRTRLDKSGQCAKILNEQLNIREVRALEKFVVDWYLEDQIENYQVLPEIRKNDFSTDADAESESKSSPNEYELDLVLIKETSDEQADEMRIFECKRSINVNSILDEVEILRNKAKEFMNSMLEQGEGPYNLKLAFFVPHGDNFELINDKIKELDTNKSDWVPVALYDLNHFAELMKLSISSFPDCTEEELKNESDDPSPSP